jgi:hypothetical protein
MALGDVTIISDVTETLTQLLTGLDVTLDSPADLKNGTGSFKKINLYLFQVVEHAYTKNQQPIALDDGTLQYPPLTLQLHYLLTPYASDTLSAHRVLGHAMRIFYENAIVTEAALPESLRLVTDKLSITLVSSKIEDLTRIWNALQTPYRLSACYEVRVVPIESTLTSGTTRVRTRINRYQQI